MQRVARVSTRRRGGIAAFGSGGGDDDDDDDARFQIFQPPRLVRICLDSAEQRLHRTLLERLPFGRRLLCRCLPLRFGLGFGWAARRVVRGSRVRQDNPIELI